MLHLFLGRKEGRKERGRSIVLCRPSPPRSIDRSKEGRKDTNKAVETRPIRLADSFGVEGQRPKNRLCSNVFLLSEIPPSRTERGEFFPRPAALSDASPDRRPPPPPPPSERKAKTAASPSSSSSSSSQSVPCRHDLFSFSSKTCDDDDDDDEASERRETRAGFISTSYLEEEEEEEERNTAERERERERRGGDRNRPSFAFVHTHSVCRSSSRRRAAALLPLHGLRQRRRGRDRREGESGLPARRPPTAIGR